MFWKVVPQIVTAVVLLVIATLDYKWFDKRTTRFKIARRVLFVLLVLFLIVSVVQVIKAEKDREEYQRQTVVRLLDHALSELGENSSTILLKVAFSLGLAESFSKDEWEIRYQLATIKSPKFTTMVPKVWVQDLKLLLEYGKEGEGAYQIILDVYGLIQKTEKEEEEYLGLIEKERRSKLKAALLASLHAVYVVLRQRLIEEEKVLSTFQAKLGKIGTGPNSALQADR